jgi:hypothetical protein
MISLPGTESTGFSQVGNLVNRIMEQIEKSVGGKGGSNREGFKGKTEFAPSRDSELPPWEKNLPL